MFKPYLVGISGGSASGKTHFLRQLMQEMHGLDLCLVSQDNYYRPLSAQPRDAKGEVNFDLPECIHLDEFANDLEKLHRGETVHRREYLFQHYDKEGRMLEFKPSPVIICEGLFIFYHADIFKQFDLKIFINADEDIALKRRLKRDVEERNIDRDFVLYQWEHHVMPAYRKYLLPFMAHADLIINNNEHFDNSLKVMGNHLKSFF